MIFELFVNPTKPEALSLSETFKKALIKKNHTVFFSNENVENIEPDIIIGFGGDGTMLTMLQKKGYNTFAKYIGINCGTLGFLQDMEFTNIYSFIDDIPQLEVERLYYLKIKIKRDSDSIFFMQHALNEFLVTGKDHNCFNAKLFIDKSVFENFSGTGIITSTPTGSTGLNFSAGGSILFPEIPAYQLTFKDAIQNAVHHCLDKSVIVPNSKVFRIKPTIPFGRYGNVIEVTADGKLIYKDFYSEIIISYSSNSILKTVNPFTDFTEKISKKLIKS